MYKEIIQVKSVEEIEAILFKYADDYYFVDNELKSVKNKNTVKSLGARYLIKKSILEYLNLDKKRCYIDFYMNLLDNILEPKKIKIQK